MFCTCTRCALGWMRCWCARGAPTSPARHSTSFQRASCLTSKVGRSKTSSHIDGPAAPRPPQIAGGYLPACDWGPRETVHLMNDALASLSAAAATDTRRELALAHDLAVGHRVIGAEIAGLRQLAEALDGAFGATLDLCA